MKKLLARLDTRPILAVTLSRLVLWQAPFLDALPVGGAAFLFGWTLW